MTEKRDGFAQADVTRRRFLHGGAAGAAALLAGGGLLAACGGGDDDGGGGGGGTVGFLNWNTAIPDAGTGLGFMTAAAQFAKAPDGIKVKPQTAPGEDYVAYITTASRARKLADAIQLYPGTSYQAVVPATRTLTDDDLGSLKNELASVQGVLRNISEPGSYFAVPAAAQGNPWYYNKAAFEEAGLDTDKPPKTWTELEEACRKLKEKGIAPLGMSGGDGATPSTFWGSLLPQFYPDPQQVTEFAQGKITLEDPGVYNSLKAIRDTYTSGWWQDDFKSKAFSDTEGDFAQGRVGIVCGLMTDIISWTVWDAKMGKDAYGVFGAPLLDNFPGTTNSQLLATAYAIAVNKDAKEPEAALAWAKYLASKEGQMVMLQNGGTFPNRKDVDVKTLTQSPGADAVDAVYKDNPTNDSFFTWLSTAAGAAAWPKLVPTLVSGDLKGYLSELAQLQKQGG